MRVNVGSKNQTKVGAVTEAIHATAFLKDAEVIPADVVIEEFGHPIGMDQVTGGAMERARQSFRNCIYSFGIEGGLVAVPHTQSGYMEVAACAIYDGDRFYLGLSPAYEWPKKVTDLIVNHGRDGSQALREAGFTDQEKIGTAGGGIFILTKGRMNRLTYNKLAVEAALIQLENREHY